MLGRGFARENRGSGALITLIIRGARWSTPSPLALGVASSRASRGTGATIQPSLGEARRCGFFDP
jgi:hypothetical protein